MSNQFKKTLIDFIHAKITDSGKPVPENFNDTTPLISSGLLESLHLLELALLLEEEAGSALDLSSIDLVKEWDTIDSIANFLNRTK